MCVPGSRSRLPTLARVLRSTGALLDSLRVSSPSFSPFPFRLGHPDLEKYSDQAWIMRYRKERDAALRAHRRQYRRRQILSKFGLARAPVSNEYERFMDVDRVRQVFDGAWEHLMVFGGSLLFLMTRVHFKTIAGERMGPGGAARLGLEATPSHTAFPDQAREKEDGPEVVGDRARAGFGEGNA